MTPLESESKGYRWSGGRRHRLTISAMVTRSTPVGHRPFTRHRIPPGMVRGHQRLRPSTAGRNNHANDCPGGVTCLAGVPRPRPIGAPGPPQRGHDSRPAWFAGGFIGSRRWMARSCRAAPDNAAFGSICQVPTQCPARCEKITIGGRRCSSGSDPRSSGARIQYVDRVAAVQLPAERQRRGGPPADQLDSLELTAQLTAPGKVGVRTPRPGNVVVGRGPPRIDQPGIWK